MSLETKAFARGITRIFTLPQLSLSLIIGLGSTFGAVLCVIAIVSALMVKPLPGVNNASILKTIDVKTTFAETMSFNTMTPHKVYHASQYFKEAGQWAAIDSSLHNIDISNIDYAVTQFDASSNITDLLGTRLIKGEKVSELATTSQVWISYTLWQTAFSGHDSIIGQTLLFNKKTYEIAGVLEDTLAIKSTPKVLKQQLWFFNDYSKAVGFLAPKSWGNKQVDNIILRPHNNDSILPTQDEIKQWMDHYIDTEINDPHMQKFNKSMATSSEISDYRKAFLSDSYQLVIALIIIAFGLLLMATLNLLNLFLTHYQGRNKEFAIQLSIGASAWRMRCLMIIENLPSFILSGILGILIGGWLIKALPLFTNNNLPLLTSVNIDQFTIIVGGFLVLALSAIFGLLSLTDVDKKQLLNNLNNSGKGTSAQSNHMLSRGLMVMQICVASILATGSVMIAQKSYDFVNEDIGFELEFVQELTFDALSKDWLAPADSSEESAVNKKEFKQLLAQLTQAVEQKIPDSNVVLAGDSGLLYASFRINSSADTKDPELQIVYQIQHFDAGYFEALGVEFLAGQTLTQQDIDNKSNQIIIDAVFADEFYSNIDYKDIIGQPLPFDDERFVGGIVEATSFKERRMQPVLYSSVPPVSQNIVMTVKLKDQQVLTIEQLAPYFSEQFPRLTLSKVEPLMKQWRKITAPKRLTLYILISITILTLALAAIGVSGLTLMTTHQKKYEMAIRMATGAKQSSLMRFIVKDSLWILLLGLSLGFIVPVFGYEWLQSKFSLLPQFNWLTLTILDIGLVVVVLLSVLIPTWRVIKQDPLSALRQE
jgi:predicted permease